MAVLQGAIRRSGQKGRAARKRLPAAISRAVARPHRATPANILTLQRAVGNRAVNQWIQASLMVGPAGDAYEQEADRMADQAMGRSASPGVQHQPLISSISRLAQRQPEEEEVQTSAIQRQLEEEEIQTQSLAQRQEEEEVQTMPAIQRTAHGGGLAASREFEERLAQKDSGRPLPLEVRRELEPKFGADFSGVRVHTGGQASELNRDIQARAFTHGQDIFVSDGQYDPGSTDGKRLLAHELTHTIQQTGGWTSRTASPGAVQRMGKAEKEERRKQLKEVLKPSRYDRLSSNYFIERTGLFQLILDEKDGINEMDDAEFDSLGANAEMAERLKALIEEGKGWFGRKTRMGKTAKWLGSWVGYGGFSRENEGDEQLLGKEGEQAQNYTDQDDKEFLENDESPLSIKKIEITLINPDAAKFIKEKGIAKAEGGGELKANAEGLEGKAQVSLQMGKEGETKQEGIIDWDVAGANLKGDGSLTGFLGAKAEGKAKGALGYSKEKGLSASARGKASAFIGLSVEAKTEISIKAGDTELVKTSGKMGAALGAGGELAGKVGWENGTFSFGAKGKVAAGLGFSWEYKIEVNVQSIASKFFGWLKSWGLWMLGY